MKDSITSDSERTLSNGFVLSKERYKYDCRLFVYSHIHQTKQMIVEVDSRGLPFGPWFVRTEIKRYRGGSTWHPWVLAQSLPSQYKVGKDDPYYYSFLGWGGWYEVTCKSGHPAFYIDEIHRAACGKECTYMKNGKCGSKSFI